MSSRSFGLLVPATLSLLALAALGGCAVPTDVTASESTDNASAALSDPDSKNPIEPERLQPTCSACGVIVGDKLRATLPVDWQVGTTIAIRATAVVKVTTIHQGGVQTSSVASATPEGAPVTRQFVATVFVDAPARSTGARVVFVNTPASLDDVPNGTKLDLRYLAAAM